MDEPGVTELQIDFSEIRNLQKTDFFDILINFKAISKH